ncbi:MAG: hypothetical protein SPK85_04605 [Prevotella sp.]|nr:hypothetical protein [Prevotella sp.]
MARKKNLDVYNRVFKLYSVYVLTDDEKKAEFESLSNDDKQKKVSGWKARNKPIIVGDLLSKTDSLNYAELSKLKEDLTEYINEVNKAISNISQKEIENKEKEKEQLKTEYNKKIEKLNKEIEVLLKK